MVVRNLNEEVEDVRIQGIVRVLEFERLIKVCGEKELISQNTYFKKEIHKYTLGSEIKEDERINPQLALY